MNFALKESIDVSDTVFRVVANCKTKVESTVFFGLRHYYCQQWKPVAAQQQCMTLGPDLCKVLFSASAACINRVLNIVHPRV